VDSDLRRSERELAAARARIGASARAFYCHNLYHMVTGMLMEFRYQGIAA
jgi:FtsP/CotA-like multicopper oxidase with cupredoxin domain